MDDKKAIDAALNARWEEALNLNQQILKQNKGNVDALNRLARAHFELGNLTSAKKYYTLALKYDPYNPIAQKNLKIIKAAKLKTGNGKGSTNNLAPLSPSLFLHEPGKTKAVSLLKVAEPAKLSQIFCGMEVNLEVKQRGISVTENQAGYLGVLPDDLAHHLVKLIRGGNKYSAFVKSVRVNGLSILIREEKRNQRFRNQPSFLDFPSFTGDQNLAINFKNEEGPTFEEEE